MKTSWCHSVNKWLVLLCQRFVFEPFLDLERVQLPTTHIFLYFILFFRKCRLYCKKVELEAMQLTSTGKMEMGNY